MKYFFPGYVHFRNDNGAVAISSDLHSENVVRVYERSLLDELHLLRSTPGCNHLDSMLTLSLHNLGMLSTREEVDALLEVLWEQLHDTLVITIFPTESCNFRCLYCYENHDTQTLSPESTEEFLRFLKSIIHHFKYVHINWFGGEPTLCRDKILYLSEKIHHLSDLYGITLTASMTTNGYLLSEQSFRMFYAAGISCYQITIDGFHHDQTRVLKNGKGTLKQIVNNLLQLHALPSSTFPFQIILRRNLLADDDDLSWYDYLYHLIGSDPRFSVLLHGVGKWGNSSSEELIYPSENENAQLIKNHKEYISKIGLTCYNDDRDAPFSKACYAHFPNSFSLRASGHLEKCTVCLDHPLNQMGRFDICPGYLNSGNI